MTFVASATLPSSERSEEIIRRAVRTDCTTRLRVPSRVGGTRLRVAHP